MRILLLFLILTLCGSSHAQDTIRITKNSDLFNKSIADKLTIYPVYDTTTYEYFLEHKSKFKGEKLNNSVANLDFTTGTYFIHFTIINETWNTNAVYLETARPITNEASLYYINQKLTSFSGDALPFKKKTIRSNRSVLPLMIGQNGTDSYILKLSSDGEIISLPFVLWKKRDFESNDRQQQFSFGIFYGIFLFVIIIYFTFFVLLKDQLFLIYTCYVAFSGLLQFSLDGYVHQYVFTSGGYLTQHTVLFVAGCTVFLALSYASSYLKVKGKLRKTSSIFAAFVLLTTFLSLIPGSIYEICYPLINGLSLITMIYLIVLGIRARKRDSSINLLFLVGLLSLLIGAVIFILGNFSVIDYPDLTQNSLKAGTLTEIICLSILMAGKYKSLQDEKEAAQKQLMIQLEQTNTQLETEVAERTKQIESQKVELKEKNDDFISSIRYAERIQNAILPHEQKIKNLLPDSFVLFRPKDIVSGDFYWAEEILVSNERNNKLVVYATADCTGHGVPGAFVSILCSNLLRLGKTQPTVNTPGEALDFVNKEINEMLNSEYSEEEIRDGMDVALCAIDFNDKTLYFAGAKNGIYIVRNKEIIEYKGDRKAIGNTISKDHDLYQTHQIPLEKDDLIYSFTDGIVDQFGGEKGKKFMSSRLKALLISISELPMDEQKTSIEQSFLSWKGGLEQVDDVLVIGVRI